ncbi:MAG: glycosyltransferase family 1 protein [Spartobacteria bacterium]|nr:glycosyltransferase family 1 protein [Spartobacteria bacterium]
MRRFSAHSGLAPLLACLGAEYVEVAPVWEDVRARSWRAGELLKNWGIRRYGSAWNSLLPGWSEAQVRRRLPQSDRPYPVHFWWGEFAAPADPAPYRRRGGRIVVSVHCSARRWDSVWLRPDGFAQADRVMLTSESQRPFVARAVPAERIRTIRHGVDVDFFAPPERREPRGKFRMFLMGNTERDHEFAAQVAAKLPAEKFEWRIRTASPEQSRFASLPGVNLLPRLADAAMLAEYQQADLLAMPMLDSAANNVILESMACGTPVMINRVGGIPEYVDPACNFVMSNDRHVDEWVDKLLELERNRDVAEQMRPATRAWAEQFDWKLIAEEYRAMYRDVLERG